MNIKGCIGLLLVIILICLLLKSDVVEDVVEGVDGTLQSRRPTLRSAVPKGLHSAVVIGTSLAPRCLSAPISRLQTTRFAAGLAGNGCLTQQRWHGWSRWLVRRSSGKHKKDTSDSLNISFL